MCLLEGHLHLLRGALCSCCRPAGGHSCSRHTPQRAPASHAPHPRGGELSFWCAQSLWYVSAMTPPALPPLKSNMVCQLPPLATSQHVTCLTSKQVSLLEIQSLLKYAQLLGCCLCLPLWNEAEAVPPNFSHICHIQPRHLSKQQAPSTACVAHAAPMLAHASARPYCSPVG